MAMHDDQMYLTTVTALIRLEYLVGHTYFSLSHERSTNFQAKAAGLEGLALPLSLSLPIMPALVGSVRYGSGGSRVYMSVPIAAA